MDDMDSFTVSRGRAIALVVVLLALLVVAGRRLAHTGAASRPAATAASLQPIAATPAPTPRVVVHVVGAVRRPGLYRLREGERVADALARAGGATPKADLAAVNLAAPLADGSQVVVPRRAASPAAAVAPTASAVPARVSLASATLEQLDALPGIGPVTAQKILDHRHRHGPFRSVDDLDAVAGIGPARVEQLRELVTP
jgi:competence protein ComEA